MVKPHARQFFAARGTDVLEECKDLGENWRSEDVEIPEKCDVLYRFVRDGLEEVQKRR
jgi:hypothetical protein